MTRVASIFVDLGIKADVPLEKRPWLLWVWIGMRAPKADGLASNEEAPKLHEIGEALDATVSATCGAQLVGRVTGAAGASSTSTRPSPANWRPPSQAP